MEIQLALIMQLTDSTEGLQVDLGIFRLVQELQ